MMGRSKSSPDTENENDVVGRAHTMNVTSTFPKKNFKDQNPNKHGPLLRRSSLPITKDENNITNITITSAEEFTDEEFALFDVDETKHRKKLALRLVSPTQSLKLLSQSKETTPSNRIRLEVPSTLLTNGNENNQNTEQSQKDTDKNQKEKETENEKKEKNNESKRDDGAQESKKEELGSPHRTRREYIKTIIEVNKDYIAIGDGEINAIYLDKNLEHGTTSKCVALRSPKLVQNVNGDFQIRHVEVWCVE